MAAMRRRPLYHYAAALALMPAPRFAAFFILAFKKRHAADDVSFVAGAIAMLSRCRAVSTCRQPPLYCIMPIMCSGRPLMSAASATPSRYFAVENI